MFSMFGTEQTITNREAGENGFGELIYDEWYIHIPNQQK